MTRPTRSRGGKVGRKRRRCSRPAPGWEPTYDDVFGTLGFTGSDRIAELLAEHVPVRARPALDLGCGTGSIGVRLAALDLTTIDGVDLSPEIVAQAATKDVYSELTVHDLHAEVLDLPGGRAGLVSAKYGRVGPVRGERTCCPGGPRTIVRLGSPPSRLDPRYSRA